LIVWRIKEGQRHNCFTDCQNWWVPAPCTGQRAQQLRILEAGDPTKRSITALKRVAVFLDFFSPLQLNPTTIVIDHGQERPIGGDYVRGSKSRAIFALVWSKSRLQPHRLNIGEYFRRLGEHMCCAC
jgi:hypothetical protein